MSISLSSQIDPFTCCLNSLLARIAAKLYRATPVFTPLTIVQAIYQFGILPEWDLQLDQYLSLDWLRDTLTIWRSNVETGPSQPPSPTLRPSFQFLITPGLSLLCLTCVGEKCWKCCQSLRRSHNTSMSTSKTIKRLSPTGNYIHVLRDCSHYRLCTSMW